MNNLCIYIHTCSQYKGELLTETLQHYCPLNTKMRKDTQKKELLKNRKN